MTDKRKSIIKSKPRTSYAVIPNALLQDRRLSFEERGMLAYLLSRPETWEISPTDLANEGGIGMQKVQKMLKRLIEFGYCTRERIRDEKTQRFTDILYMIYDTPQVEKPHMEKPRVENHPQVSKDSLVSKDSFASDEPTQAQPPKERPRNHHFDAIVKAFNYDPKRMTKTQSGVVGKVASELKSAGFTPEDVATIYAYCKRKFDDFTAVALTKHASDAIRAKPKTPRYEEA